MKVLVSGMNSQPTTANKMSKMSVPKAQSISEYSICVVIIVLALVAMQLYVKRGMQGRYLEVADSAMAEVRAQALNAQGATYNADKYPNQYEPVDQAQKIGSVQDTIEKRNALAGGQVNKTITKDTLTRQGTVKEVLTYGVGK